jgi:hypothetical protein
MHPLLEFGHPLNTFLQLLPIANASTKDAAFWCKWLGGFHPHATTLKITVGPLDSKTRRKFNTAFLYKRIPNFDEILKSERVTWQAVIHGEPVNLRGHTFPQHLNILLMWISTDELPPLQAKEITEHNACDFWTWNPHRVWMLCNKLKHPQLMDRVMTALLQAMVTTGRRTDTLDPGSNDNKASFQD